MQYLFERLYEPFVPVTVSAMPDGEGGQIKIWTEGEPFDGYARFDDSEERTVGSASAVSSKYTLTVPVTVNLTYHDIVRRVSDGKYFRVTSDGDDVITPPVATFSFLEVKAEEWKLPDGGVNGGDSE